MQKHFSSRHDHIFVWAKNIDAITIKRLRQADVPDHYNQQDSDGRIFYLKPLRAMGADGHRAKRPSMYFPIEAPDGSEVFPKNPDQ